MAKLPTHERAVLARLPLPLGEEWVVVQGFDERRGTHAGRASFCWDFGRVGSTTVDAPVCATAAGDVVMVVDNDLTDVDNRVEVAVAPDELHTHLHLKAGAAEVSIGDRVAAGSARLAGWTPRPPPLCVRQRASRTVGFTTRPMGFAFFERRTPGGTWKPVEFGMPPGGSICAEDGGGCTTERPSLARPCRR